MTPMARSFSRAAITIAAGAERTAPVARRAGVELRKQPWG